MCALLLFSVASIGVASAGLPAQSGGFAVREQSAYGQGSSFAGMAAPGYSISSMFWSPAAVTTVTGTTIEGNVTGVFPQSEPDVELTRSTLTGLGIRGKGGDVGETGISPCGADHRRVLFRRERQRALWFSTTWRAPWVGMLSHLDAKAPGIRYKVEGSLASSLFSHSKRRPISFE